MRGRECGGQRRLTARWREGAVSWGKSSGRQRVRTAFSGGGRGGGKAGVSLAAYQMIGTKPELLMVESAEMSGRPKVRAVATMSRSEGSVRILLLEDPADTRRQASPSGAAIAK